MKKKKSQFTFKSFIWLACLLLAFAGVSCNSTTNPNPVSVGQTSIEPPKPAATLATPTLIATLTPLQSETPILAPAGTPTPVPTSIPTETATAKPMATLTETPTETNTITVTPTYAILRGEVLVRSNCRYGPGEPYLYKYGLVPGSNLEIIGRTDTGSWILVQAIGGNNPCWVKASLMNIKGDVMAVEPTFIPLPQSPYYGPPTWVLPLGTETK